MNRLVPQRHDLVDAAFLAVLTVLALIGFRTTFSGTDYLVAGVVAMLVGLLLAHLVTALRLPVLVTALATIAAYFVFAGLLVLGDDAVLRVLPTPHIADVMWSTLIHGWKQLLTTLPPVATTGPLLAIPYLLGLLSGAVGFTLARRSRMVGAPLAAPVAALAAVLLLGTATPSARLWQGVGFGCVALYWAVVRARRRTTPTRRADRSRGATYRRTQVAIAVGLVAVSGAAAWAVGPHLPGGGRHRVVLRNYVATPFDIGVYASPLVGFRKYTKDAHELYDQTLFTESGLPQGSSLQIATLDSYNGSVWTATNGTVPTGPGQPLDSFQRVGSRIELDAPGKDVAVTVHIAAAYASADDLNAWLPTAGVASSVDFSGSDAGSHDAQFRYNLATGSGIVADRLQSGDSYTVHAVVDAPTLPADAEPFGAPTLPASTDSFVSSRADQWSAKIAGVAAQVEAVAKYMRENGAYSDGGPGQGQYLPGHSTGRLTTFLNLPQLVGDDEQYAATFALIANYLGLPARVVLEATPELDGQVKGADVHAAVQLHIRSGSQAAWVTIPRSEFMPPESKTPNKQPPLTQQNAAAAVVPPPNPARPPSTLTEPDQPSRNSQRLSTDANPKPGWTLPGWVLTVLLSVGIPLLVLLAIAGLIIGAKRRRRHLRRSRGSPADRFSTGWRELIDHARDLGVSVPTGRTRREEADVLAANPAAAPAAPLAVDADAGVFGAGTPAPEAAEAYWRKVDGARHSMNRSVGRARRLRAALSVRSWLPGRAG
ncbi:transglutaminase domain-containing protein [Jatrophihabitans sp.]|uniref:transglutaminase domain-containing protein n=1 Tax=Jatrophihabitans sp. TaxID=1932789 RepID=UPI0030C74BB1|nr:hypothetical protein [Jatrophihabitans sp.]